MDIHYDLVNLGLRDKADLLWLSNEPALGDFGVGAIHFKKEGDYIPVKSSLEKSCANIISNRKYKKGVKEVNEKNIYSEATMGTMENQL